MRFAMARASGESGSAIAADHALPCTHWPCLWRAASVKIKHDSQFTPFSCLLFPTLLLSE
eukprot:3419400-Pyramimonas_sp.AAC.1